MNESETASAAPSSQAESAGAAKITPSIDPQVRAGIYGHVDSVGPDGIVGWLIDMADPARVFQIDAHLDGERVCCSETYLDRPDVGVVIGRSVCCGFALPWEAERLARVLQDRPGAEVLTLQVLPRGDDRGIGADKSLQVADLREWLAALPAQPERYSGRIDSLSAYRIAGHVIDRTSPHTPVALEILLDGVVVDQVLADRARPGLGTSDTGLGCGFEWLVPRTFHDGTGRCVEVRVRDGVQLLAGSGARLTFPGAESRAVRALHLVPGPVWTRGWAVDADSQEPVTVALLIDGNPARTVLAGTFDAELADDPRYPSRDFHACFSLPTPARALDGWPHEFTLRVPEWGAEQPAGSRVTWARGNHFGRLVACSGDELTGWVAFRTAPGEEVRSVPVEILIGGELAGQCFLSEKPLEVDAGTKYQVAYPFTANFGRALAGELSARYAGVELRALAKAIAPAQKLAGSLDGVSRETIRGWAADLNHPDRPLELELLIDGQAIASFLPTLDRRDVLTTLKLSTGRPGFALPTPEFLLDGNLHRIEVRYAASRAALPSKIREVRLMRNFRGLPLEDPHPVLSEFIGHGPRALPVAAGRPLVSIVVLNRNGEHILDALLSSFLAVNTFKRYEFIVVDHASKDASLAILERWRARGVPLTIVPLAYNGSFSASNNLAISKYARGEYVLLLNNDIVFVQDVLGELVRTLKEDPRTGLVGMKLLNVVEDRGVNFYPPIQHLGIRFGDFGKAGVLPYDEMLSPNSAHEAFRPSRPAGVTGAALLCRREEYRALGGLDESYVYGYEDVDICLKYRVLNQQEIVCRNDLQALHHRGYSRLSGREMRIFEHLDRNHLTLMRRWGYAIRSLYRRSLTAGDRVYAGERLRIAFAVRDTDPKAAGPDYFSALELARALADSAHVEPVFLSERDNWYDLDRVHVLVVMHHDYDLRAIANARADLVKVAWLRTHFETWPRQTWFESFDIYLSAAPRFAARLGELGYRCEPFPLAANPEAMAAGQPDAALRCVVAFNGAARPVGHPLLRVVEDAGRTVATLVAGRDWEGSSLQRWHKGILPYERMPDLYASAEIVLDDTDREAGEWGAVTSRVFEALAAGTLTLGNSVAASAELFEGLLPIWSTPEDALGLIRRYAQDGSARRELAQRLQALVVARHTWRQRGAALMGLLGKYATEAHRIAIKAPVPAEGYRESGDWHFADGLRRALKALGHTVRIDLADDWDKSPTNDDVVIVLRGESAYTPDPARINLLWILSHPTEISVAECAKYDHVFCASASYTQHLQSVGVGVSTLLRCTDPQLMRFVQPDPARHRERLFVGDAGDQPRRIVADLLTVGVDVAILGREWDGLVPEQMVEGGFIGTEALCEYYSGAGVVCNDHPADAAEWGFLAGSLFDAAACGAYIVSDMVPGLDEAFDGRIATYETAAELVRLTSAAARERWEPGMADALRELVVSRHTFGHRAAELLAKVGELARAKLSGADAVATTAAEYPLPAAATARDPLPDRAG